MGSAFHCAVRRFAVNEAEHGSYRIGGGRYAERIGQQQENDGDLQKADELIAHDLDSRLELLAGSQLLPGGFDAGSWERHCLFRRGADVTALASRRCRTNCVCECSRGQLPETIRPRSIRR